MAALAASAASASSTANPSPARTNPPASTQKLNCYIAEQVESAPYTTGRLNLPENIPDGESRTYQVQYGRRLDFADAGEQATTLRLPGAMLSAATLDVLVSQVGSGNVTVRVDVGNDGSWDWETTQNVDNAATLTTADLAGAFNAYWSAQGAPTTGTLDVPVKVSLSTGGQVLLTNLRVDSAGSKLRTVRLPGGATYTTFNLDFTVEGSGTGPLAVSLDVGGDGTVDWSTSTTAGLPHRLLSGNLAGAVNAYLSGKGGEVDVPIRIFVAPDHPVRLEEFRATANPATDLVAGSVSVAAADIQAAAWREGDVVPVQAVVQNSGSRYSGPVTVAFFATAEGWGDWYIGSDFVANIPAGGQVTVGTDWDTTGFSGDVPVKAVVNPYGRVAETDTSDNVAQTSAQVEPVATPTPTPTPVPPTPTPTPVPPTPTPTPVPPTPTFTPTPVPPTPTPTPLPPTPTFTPTPVPPTPTPTPRPGDPPGATSPTSTPPGATYANPAPVPPTPTATPQPGNPPGATSPTSTPTPTPQPTTSSSLPVATGTATPTPAHQIYLPSVRR
ncbi:MAG: hypothetical protein KatS3mg050_4538 [Litorilinea sp.]|nr:MAG: hypothetical protein KatS3mg050_4538 [Litorilinea sp.]